MHMAVRVETVKSYSSGHVDALVSFIPTPRGGWGNTRDLKN